MEFSDHPERLGAAAEQFARQTGRQDGPQIVASLSAGLTRLRELLFTRVHQDVESNFGMDSMLIPVSESKVATACRVEVELFQIPLSASDALEYSYVTGAEDWYLAWLTELRLGNPHPKDTVVKTMADYRKGTPEERRLRFTDVLARVCPESRRAPLVLFRLFPRSVRLATAIAYNDVRRTTQLRAEQAALLPAITDCHECHGRVLENGDSCRACGNPVWTFDWMTRD